ncbi:MAG: TonB-dependent receptor, partial [Vicinamibacteria bacterium]
MGLVLVCFAALPGLSWGQATPEGAIDGVIRDETGAVVPGATVEASSPALIGGPRRTVTDGDGRYRFLRLPVGEYAVTFSLPGFATLKREGVVVNAAFTATINAELSVAAVAESVTVTGESPIVDVRSNTQQVVLDDEVINTIPSARNVFDMTKFVIGSSTSGVDVGGSTTHLYTPMQIHGSRSQDRVYYRDGIPTVSFFGGGDAPNSEDSVGAQEEVTYQMAAIPASVSVGGFAINMVTKTGGDELSGSFYTSFTNNSLQSSNLDQELEDRGVRATSGMHRAYDLDGSIGGPIKRDKLWFFGSWRLYSVDTLLANQFFPDGSQQNEYVRNGQKDVKVTWQVNPSNKLSVNFSHENALRPTRREGATFVEHEASSVNRTEPDNYFVYGNYAALIGDSWLFEGALSKMKYDYSSVPQPGQEDEPPRLDIVNSVLTGSGVRYRVGQPRTNFAKGVLTWLGQAQGSHELQMGVQGLWGGYLTERRLVGDMILRTRNGVPDSADLANTPLSTNNQVRDLGIFAQDRWQIGQRLTLNAGVRYDYKNVFIPPQSAPAGTWVPARETDEIPVITWHNVVPRLGVAYDLFGSGRTVVKGSVSKYMGNEATGVAEDVNPLFYSTNRCVWADLNGDNYADALELSDCEGFSGAASTTIDPDLRRPFNREYSLGFQHQLAPNFGLTVMYHRKENRDLRSERNLAVPRETYIPVTITNPLTNDPLTIFNQDPVTQGLQDNILTNSPVLDNDYNGIEVTVERRFSQRMYLQAGYHFGKNLGRISDGELNDPNDD